MTLRGAPARLVREAIERADPLPGGGGFAGVVDETLVRDVLGRQLVFVETADTRAAERTTAAASEVDVRWAFDPDELVDPALLPAGHRLPLDALDGSDAGADPLANATQCWSLPNPEPVDRVTGIDQVRTALEETLAELPDIPVAFSGGVDSAVVASATSKPLYVAGMPGSHDREVARRAAARLDRELRVVDLDPKTIEAAVPAVAAATGRTNPMDVAIALPLYLVARRLREDGFDRMAVGQGADELFGGYDKIARAPADDRVVATTIRGARRELMQTLPDQLERDLRAIRAAGVEVVAPMLTDRVIEAALALPDSAIVDETGQRKHGLRLAARTVVPDAIAFREKKAVQYGSLVSRELDRLARQAGFKRREEDHVEAYVHSRIEE
jgi:asparagine synthase (glutamine-hydrolysing)